MRKVVIALLLIVPLMLAGGCAKDQIKPDSGVAPAAASNDQNADRLAAEKAAAEKAAAERAAAERAAAEKAAADRLAAERAAADKAAADRAAAEQAFAGKAAEKAAQQLAMINFDYDSFTLSQAARDILYTNAEYLLKKYQGNVKLEGHCDERGSDEYNLALGENRAKAAMNYLITLGVQPERLSIISYGKEKPLDPGHDESAWARNRRVEFTPAK